jgi:acyl-coenzyme A thioesterase PaaI-like protein
LTSEVPAKIVGPVAEGGVQPFEIVPHNCFACGSLNASGMQLELHVGPDRAWTDVSLDRRFEGWDGIAHGGILCTILDEVMAWSLVGQDNWGLTARLSVDFKRPAYVARPLHAEGRMVRARRRLVETRSRIVDSLTGEELATASALYVAAGAARKLELQARYGFRRR